MEENGPTLSGQLFVARLEYLRRTHGPQAVARILESLPAHDRERLKGVEASGWYPFSTLVRFDRTAARVLSLAEPDVFELFGAASSRMRHEWIGEHAHLLSPHAFLQRVAEEHRRFHTFGRAAYRRTGFREGEIAFSEYPELDETYCLGAKGYLRTTVELLTGRAAEIEERECQRGGGQACVFWLRWSDREPLDADVTARRDATEGV